MPPAAATSLRSMQITEIYKSLQGESTHAGLPCVFVRLDRMQSALLLVRQRVYVPRRAEDDFGRRVETR